MPIVCFGCSAVIVSIVWVCFGMTQVSIVLWNGQVVQWPRRVAILEYGSGNAKVGWKDRVLCHDLDWKFTNLTIDVLLHSSLVAAFDLIKLLCAHHWLQEPPKEVIRIIEKVCGHLQNPMKEVWEHRLPLKLPRQCL